MKIRSYEQQISPQGEIGGVRATGDDFGAQVGRAEGDMAQADQQVVQFNEQLAAARDQVWRNQAVSEYQLKQMQALQAAKTDPDFVKKYGADGQQFASSFEQTLDTNKNSLAAAAPSPRSARLLTDELTNVNTNLMGHALAYQAQAGGEYMKTQATEMMQNDAKIVEADPSQASMVLDRGKLAIARMPLLDDASRTKLLNSYEQNIAMSAGKSLVLHHPEAVLQAIAPDVMATFKPTARVEAAKSEYTTPVTAFAPPSALLPQVATYSPLIKSAAASHGVDANFLAAQIQQESKGNPNAVNKNDIAVTGQPSIGIAQFQPDTAAQYGVTNPKDPNQAIPGMAAYMSDLLKQFGGDYKKAAVAYNWGPGNLKQAIATYGNDWQQHIPSSTQDYVDGIFKTAAPMSSADQSLASLQQKQATAEPSRASTNPDWFNKLDWEQQFAIVHEAEQGVRANQVRDAQTIQLAEQQRKAQQQKQMNEMFNKVGDPNNPLTVADIRTSDLDYQNKEHMLTAINAVNRGEMATDPAVFNTLFQRVHLPTGDPNKLADDDALLPYVGKGLSITDLNVLRNEIRGKNTPDGAALADLKKNFFSMAKSQIDNSIFGVSLDPGGKDKFYQFQQNVISTVDREVRAGADPLELFDPKSSKYLGKLIPLYQRTNQQQAADVAAHLRGATATPAAALPRQAGETPAAYIQRTKGTQK